MASHGGMALCGEMWHMAGQLHLGNISQKKIRIFGEHLAVSVTKPFSITSFQT